jgi:putative ATPase
MKCTASTRAQQDAFLPHVESGLVTFIGATTENPSFEVVGALLSRAQVYVLKSLDEAGLAALLQARAGTGWAGHRRDAEEARKLLLAPRPTATAAVCSTCWNSLPPPKAAGRDSADAAFVGERAGALPAPLRQGRRCLLRPDFRPAQVGARLQTRRRPLLVHAHARRRRRPALSGPAHHPHGLSRTSAWPIPAPSTTALDAVATYERLGSPEGELALAQAVLYLACAPKSNAVYTAYQAARTSSRKTAPGRCRCICAMRRPSS